MCILLPLHPTCRPITSQVEYTSELLKHLGNLHASDCSGFSCVRRLYEDDAHLSVAENLFEASTDIEFQNGTKDILIYYFSKLASIAI